MKQKKWFMRAMSGVLTVLTLLSTMMAPISAFAAEGDELDAYVHGLPMMTDVLDQLAPSEVVYAESYEVEVGTEIDLYTNFNNLSFDEQSVKVHFYEAKNDAGQGFSTSHADVYQATYYVEPYSGNPAYRFTRIIAVVEPEIVADETAETAGNIPDEPTEEAGEDGEEPDSDTELLLVSEEPVTDIVEDYTEDEPRLLIEDKNPEIAEATNGGDMNDSEAEADDSVLPDTTSDPEMVIVSEEEMIELLEEAAKQETVDWESGVTVSGVLIWASEQEKIDLFGMEAGETVSFKMPKLKAAARSTEYVSITKGDNLYYESYGLGTYCTSPYYIVFGSVSAVAFCVQPALPGPGDGTYYIEKVGDNADLAKVIYYGTDASGKNNFFDNKHPDFNIVVRFIITHIAASYANGSADAFTGANATAQNLAMELYYYAVGMPEIPDVTMSISDSDVTAYRDGDEQRTKNITFYADPSMSISLNLPKGVVFHNVSTGTTSKAGATVSVPGGTTFYLSAPLTQTSDVSGSWTAKMNSGSFKDYSAYKITTGGGVQDLAFVFGEGVEKTSNVSLKVSWLVAMANIYITKSDENSGKNLAGAVFGVYSDAACSNLIARMPATDASGSSTVEIVVSQDTVYLKEITAPKGYLYNTSAVNVNVAPGQDSRLTVTNKEIMGSITIYKEGEVLTGTKPTEDGVSFLYEKRRLSGASYRVTAAEDIFSADGTLIYHQGDVVAEKLTTGSDGSVTLSDLHLGTYEVTEIGAPKDYINEGVSKKTALAETDPTQGIVMETVSFENARQKAVVKIEKVDAVTKNPLAGAIYGLFARETINSADGDALVQKDTLIEKVTTGADGTASFTADLPLNADYYVKELQAPKQYIRNESDVFSFTAAYTQETESEIVFTHTFENEAVNARIDLIKMDVETGAKTQGDATLEGATYGLYAREAIIHPDGKTGVIYEKDYQIATLTTDRDGKASIEGLPLGKYYIKELVPSEGYLLDATEYDVDCADEGDMVGTVKRSVTSNEQVIRQPFQIIKAANNGKTDADLLHGAGFTVYLISSLKENADGSYDFSSASPVVITEDGQREIFTDDRGYAQTISLPYGKYIVRETTTPQNFTPVDDFVVTVRENNPTEPQVWRVLLDEEFSAKLKIVKKDAESKKTVQIADTEFKVYDLDSGKYVEQVTTYPETAVHKSYFTDANGYLILPENLLPGQYRIEEVKAPEGYILGDSVDVAVEDTAAYEMDSVSGDAIITVELENQPVKGNLTVTKKGEVLKGYGKDFLYELQPLPSTEFAIYAAEDIYTPDHQLDANGNRVVIYAKDALVTTVTSDENGVAVAENLPLGSYYVKETKAPEGFVLNSDLETVTFIYLDQKTPVIERSIEFTDYRQKVSLSVEKQDAQNGNKVSGAVFGLYTKDAITVNGKTIVDANKLLQEVTTDSQGVASFRVDLPLGYPVYVKEIKAPAGFLLSDTVLDFAPSYQGQDTPVVMLVGTVKNESTRVAVTKSDITTGVELDGATLTVLDKKGHVVERWTSEKNNPHIIQYLTVGETYTLREEYAPYGYLKAKDVTFTVQDTAEIQKVQMQDEVPTALLIVTKKGEFLNKVTLGNNAKGILEHLFEYVTGNLTEVSFEVYAAEDIKAADGVSGVLYKKDALVGTITTDSTGIAKLSGIPVGKYYVKEVSTAHGYVLDDQIRTVDLSYRDQNTAVVSYDENWQNNRQKATIHILKVEKDSQEPLAGAVFGLFAAEDIKSDSGKVLVKKDSIIELKTTDADGKIDFIADLPVDGNYYIQEQYAPTGYVTNHTKKEFTFSYGEASQKEIRYEFTFENEPTTVVFSKLVITGEHEIPGAHLEVRDSNGNLIDEWVSTEKPHVIQKLEAGAVYSMIETKPADGYVTAEKVTFTVEDSYNLQRVEMKDDVTKVEISKTDITTGKELPGAKLTILDKDGKVVVTWVSTDQPQYIEKLPIGDYTLCEETAPNGYLKAENVKFTVKDTGEIQKVEMKDSPVKAPDNPDTPKTGDTHKPLLWIGAAALGVAMLGTSLVLGRRKRYK